MSEIGERKAKLYVKQILEALENFVRGARAGALVKKTLRMLVEGKSFEEIARIATARFQRWWDS